MSFKLSSSYLDAFDLPDDIAWYNVEGKKLFELRDATSGNLTSGKLVAYLIKEASPKRWFKYGILFPDSLLNNKKLVDELVENSIKSFQEHLSKEPEPELSPAI